MSPTFTQRSHTLPLVPYNSNSVIGYHGTDETRASKAITEQEFIPSHNIYDWLGHGVYFWESYSRAYQWAEDNYQDQGRVIRTRIRYGRCIDFFDTNWAPAIQSTYKKLKHQYEQNGMELPRNKNGYRVLDCLIVNKLISEIGDVDTVRAAFFEGESLYPTSIFVGLTHVQLVVRNPKVIISPLELIER